MAKIRDNEFVQFVREAKACRHGALEMKGNEVRSYGVLIARIDHQARKIAVNNEKYSRTTSRHQACITHAASRLPDFVFEVL